MRAVIDDTTRLVYCGDRSPEELFRIPFLADILSAVGLGSHHLMRFPAGARFKRITVTAPSFEENNLGHLAYARLCNRIGDILTLNLPSKPSRRPLYLSKHKVQRGVSRVVNEGEVVDELVRLGADVVCPEELSIAEQVQLWRDRAVVYGFIGSAFHTGIFSRRPRCVVLNSGPMVWSNQLILDCINGASVDYYYSTAGIINAGRNGSFGNNFTLNNRSILPGRCWSGRRRHARRPDFGKEPPDPSDAHRSMTRSTEQGNTMLRAYVRRCATLPSRC